MCILLISEGTMHIFWDMVRRNAGESSSATVTESVPPGPWRGLCGHCPALTVRIEHSLDTNTAICKRAITLLFAFVDFTGRNLGQVIFCNNPFSGLCTLIGLFLSQPDAAVSGLVASTTSLIIALALRQPRNNVAAGLTGFNGVLLGTVLPSVLQVPHPWHWPLICGGAALTAVLNNSLGQVLSSVRPSLPVLSIPFNLVVVLAALVLRASGHPTVFLTTTSNSTLPLDNNIDIARLLEGSFLGAGQVFAVQDMWCSGLILFGILICSPLLAISGFLGSLAATCFGAFVSSSLHEAAYNGIYGYNGLLASTTLCFFFVPTWRSFLLGVATVVLTAALQLVLESPLQQSGVPLLSMPFVISTLLVLGASSEGLPRPTLFSYPELHRALWLRDRRENRRDAARNSMSLGSSARPVSPLNSTISIALEIPDNSSMATSSIIPSGPNSSRSNVCTPTYRQQRY